MGKVEYLFKTMCGGFQHRFRSVLQYTRDCDKSNSPPTKQKRIFNAFDCENQEKFVCSKGNCRCQNVVHKTMVPTIESKRAIRNLSGCRRYNISISPIWKWDPVCRQLHICYSNCNTNKTLCDRLFKQDLQLACFNLPEESNPAHCLKISNQMFELVSLDVSNHRFVFNQRSHCRCVSEPVGASFQKYLKEFCDGNVVNFRDLSECEETFKTVFVQKKRNLKK